MRALTLVLAAALAAAAGEAPPPASPPPKNPGPPRPGAPSALRPSAFPVRAGERITMRVTYAKILAGRAWVSVEEGEDAGRPVLRLRLDVKSEGFFAWLFRYHVDDHTVALWDPATACSFGIEKHLREGRAARDQVVRIDPVGGIATVEDGKIAQKAFNVGPCALDVFSVFFVARMRGLGPDGRLSLRVFDNGRLYDLPFRHLGYEVLDLPPPLGRGVRTEIVEPVIPKGSGLFAQEGRLLVWATADLRRIPVRLRSKVPIGFVSADLEEYVPPAP